MKNSNDVTKKLVEVNNLDNPKEIANKNNTKLLQLLVVAVDMVVDYINKNK